MVDGERKSILFRDAAPILHAGAAQRIGPQLEARSTHRIHIQHAAEVVYILRNVIVPVRARSLKRAGITNPPHIAEAGGQNRVGAVLNPAGGIGVRRAAVRRVVLEAPVLGGIVGRRDYDTVGRRLRAPPVVGQNGVRKRGRGRVTQGRVDQGLNPVARQDLERAGEGRLRESVGILGQKQRPGHAVGRAIFHDRLSDGEDVVLVERTVVRGSAVARGPEAHLLRRNRDIRPFLVIRRDQPRKVDQHLGQRRLPGKRMECHVIYLTALGGAGFSPMPHTFVVGRTPWSAADAPVGLPLGRKDLIL